MTIEQKKYDIPGLGLELEKDEIDALIGMFAHPGYKQYCRILERTKDISVETAMATAATAQQFANAQGEFQLIKQLMYLPDSAISIRQEK
jgi:hypothetical protein